MYILCVDNEFRVRGLILEGLTKSHKVSSLMRLSISRLPSHIKAIYEIRPHTDNEDFWRFYPDSAVFRESVARGKRTPMFKRAISAICLLQRYFIFSPMSAKYKYFI